MQVGGTASSRRAEHSASAPLFCVMAVSSDWSVLIRMVGLHIMSEQICWSSAPVDSDWNRLFVSIEMSGFIFSICQKIRILAECRFVMDSSRVVERSAASFPHCLAESTV
jgi:hypothetical protein